MTGAEPLADAVAGNGGGAASGAQAATAASHLPGATGAVPASPGAGPFSGRAATLPLPALSAGPSDGLVVDIGGTKLLVGVARQGVIAKQRSFQVSQFAGAADMMDMIAATGRRLGSAAGVAVESAAVAVAGRLDRESGTVLNAVNLPFADFPLAAELSQRLGGAPVRIEQDAVCGLVGEAAAGAARGFASVIYLTVSTGISAGILIDGAVLTGARGAAGKLGHTPAVSPGIACWCGLSGCLEAYTSGRALAELGQQAAASGASPALAAALAARGQVTAKDVLAAARRGDPASAGIIDHAIELLSGAIRLLAMTLDPELVVLGGGVMSNSYFADRIVAAAGPPGGPGAPVRPALLGARSVMYGAMLFLGGPERSQRSVRRPAAAMNGGPPGVAAAGKGAP
jgi:glucokinase